jgi:discoidin domain receptor family protein 2
MQPYFYSLIANYLFIQAPCRNPEPLGMASGKIPDEAITASSSYSIHYKPSFARLTMVGSSCSWTTTEEGKNSPWLHVDLGQLTTVTGIATQGTCSSSTAWVKSFSVSYSTEPNSWTPYEESENVKVSRRSNLVWGNLTQHGFRN